MTFVCAL